MEAPDLKLIQLLIIQRPILQEEEPCWASQQDRSVLPTMALMSYVCEIETEP